MSKNILILDDEPNVVSALSRLLRRNQYVVYEALNVDSAFIALDENDIGVIVSDQMMPGCSGVEFLNLVRQRYPNIVRIILSGYSEHESLLEAINEGELYRYIKKPWDNKTLLLTISEAFIKWSCEWQCRLLKMAFNNSMEGVFFVNGEGVIYGSNPIAPNLLGYGDVGINGLKLSDIEPEDVQHQSRLMGLSEFGKWRGQAWALKSNGVSMPVAMTVTKVITDRNVSHYVYVFYDITDEYQYQLNIEHKAYHDDLTALPNRMLFQDRVERALAQAKRNDWMVIILFLDLDDFKPVNDKYGHQIGDEALQIVAKRLLALVREADTVSRVGGDEFAILLPKFANNVSKLHEFSLKVVECIKEPIQIDPDIQFNVGVCVGVASYPSCGADVSALLKSADIAMYTAKCSGKNNYKLYKEISSEN